MTTIKQAIQRLNKQTLKEMAQAAPQRSRRSAPVVDLAHAYRKFKFRDGGKVYAPTICGKHFHTVFKQARAAAVHSQRVQARYWRLKNATPGPSPEEVISV